MLGSKLEVEGTRQLGQGVNRSIRYDWVLQHTCCCTRYIDQILSVSANMFSKDFEKQSKVPSSNH
jgi:hypothetical protein